MGGTAENSGDETWLWRVERPLGDAKAECGGMSGRDLTATPSGSFPKFDDGQMPPTSETGNDEAGSNATLAARLEGGPGHRHDGQGHAGGLELSIRLDLDPPHGGNLVATSASRYAFYDKGRGI